MLYEVITHVALGEVVGADTVLHQLVHQGLHDPRTVVDPGQQHRLVAESYNFV